MVLWTTLQTRIRSSEPLVGVHQQIAVIQPASADNNLYSHTCCRSRALWSVSSCKGDSPLLQCTHTLPMAADMAAATCTAK